MFAVKDFLKELKINRKKLILTAVAIISSVVLIASLISIIKIFTPPAKIKEIQDIASKPVTVIKPDGNELIIPIDFESLCEVNSDIYAWISIPEIGVDYPILRSAQEDFYLTHDFEKKTSAYGALYTQSYNADTFGDFNTVIYGHNMINGSMFGSLKKYRNKEFFDQNEHIFIYTPNRILKYRIFAAYTFDDRHLLLSYDFANTEQRKEYINSIMQGEFGGNIRNEAELTENSQIITLSTCAAKDDERFLVQAVLVSDSDFTTTNN